VDRFMKRLRVRDDIMADIEAREAERTSPDLAMAELGLDRRYLSVYAEAGIEVVGDFMARWQEGGDDAILAISGIGRKVLADTKKALRMRGYPIEQAEAAEA
jgi:DNA-directed RNA polymerase alpha subunit